jgi:hypothetical protein
MGKILRGKCGIDILDEMMLATCLQHLAKLKQVAKLASMAEGDWNAPIQKPNRW